MIQIIILDTSIYLNVLNIPGFNQHADTIYREIGKIHQTESAFMLLPLAAVWETGNHIARLNDGQTRRRYAQKLLTDVTCAFKGEAPYRATHFPDRHEFLRWLTKFPDMAMRSKSATKQHEGISLADHSIIEEWERNCVRHPGFRVRIWSLDSDLTGYDRQP